MHRKIFLCSVFFLLSVSVVIPNSAPIINFLSLVLTSFLGFRYVRWERNLNNFVLIYLLGVLVTLVYIYVGYTSGATDDALIQTFAVYVVSPALWIVVSASLARVLQEKSFAKWFVFFALASNLSVAAFFYLFINYGADSVSFLKESANVSIEDGSAGATMHVYGSLIFLTSAFFAAGSVVSNLAVRLIVFFALFLSAITSGRSALLLALPIGIVVGSIFSKSSEYKKLKIKNFLYAFGLSFLFAVGGFSFFGSETVDLYVVFDRFFDELASGGGSERSEQFLALVKGIFQSNGLGVGHGIGVDYIRSEKYPWRYELVWVATILRVGVVGSLVYLLPFIYGLFFFYKIYRSKKVRSVDLFLFGGFVSAFVASNTNPYIEGFGFQWMYILPPVFWLVRFHELESRSSHWSQ